MSYSPNSSKGLNQGLSWTLLSGFIVGHSKALDYGSNRTLKRDPHRAVGILRSNFQRLKKRP